jgi:hypothetical protein
MSRLIANPLRRLATVGGATMVNTIGRGPTGKPLSVHSALRRGAISVFEVMTPTQIDEVLNNEASTVDVTSAFQEVLDHLQTKSKGYGSPRFRIDIPRARYPILGADGIVLNWNANILQVAFVAEEGANLVGNGTNTLFSFKNGGTRNRLRGLTLEKAARGVLWTTNNRDQCLLMVEDIVSASTVDTFLDTGSYAESRSSEINIDNCLIDQPKVAVRSFVDQLTLQNSRIYARDGSYEALLYLGGDGVASLEKLLLIPNAKQIANPENSRWIDFASKVGECTPGDRSVKTLSIRDVRCTLESARPFIWTFDDCPTKPNGAGQVSSIVIENSPILGTGGAPVVTLKQGYPGSIKLDGVKVLASNLVAVDAANTAPPVASAPGAITSFVIEINERTRLSQSNSNNTGGLIDPKLYPFLVDTTPDSARFRRSMPDDVRYRRRCVPAGNGRVKATFKIFFDSENAAHNRDALAFIVSTLSDVGLAPAAGRAMYHGIVSLVAGNENNTDIKALSVTPLAQHPGGISFSASATPLVYFGTGDAGSATIASNSKTGVEKTITISFPGGNADVCWVYLKPWVGISENEWDKQQYGSW